MKHSKTWSNTKCIDWMVQIKFKSNRTVIVNSVYVSNLSLRRRRIQLREVTETVTISCLEFEAWETESTIERMYKIEKKGTSEGYLFRGASRALHD